MTVSRKVLFIGETRNGSIRRGSGKPFPKKDYRSKAWSRISLSNSFSVTFKIYS